MPSDEPGQAYVVGAVDDQPWHGLESRAAQQRDLNHHDARQVLEPDGYPAEDMGMGYGLELPELRRIAEDHGGQRRPIDPALGDDFGPAVRNGPERRSVGSDHVVTDGVGIDGVHTQFLEHPTNGALSGTDSAPELHATVLTNHDGSL